MHPPTLTIMALPLSLSINRQISDHSCCQPSQLSEKQDEVSQLRLSVFWKAGHWEWRGVFPSPGDFSPAPTSTPCLYGSGTLCSPPTNLSRTLIHKENKRRNQDLVVEDSGNTLKPSSPGPTWRLSLEQESRKRGEDGRRGKMGGEERGWWCWGDQRGTRKESWGQVRMTRVTDSLPPLSPSWEGTALHTWGKNRGHLLKCFSANITKKIVLHDG